MTNRHQRSGQTRGVMVGMQPSIAKWGHLTPDTTEVEWEGGRYHKVDGYDFWGFYDWLRTESGRIVGLRFKPFRSIESFEAVAPISECHIDVRSGDVWVFFAGTPLPYSEERSADQAFGANWVFAGVNKQVLVWFPHSGDAEEWSHLIENVPAGMFAE